MKRSESFKLFLSCFPQEKLPITLSSENASYFSEKNKALPIELIQRFILQGLPTDHEDEFTEYIACCRLPVSKDVHAVIYWRGSLMHYAYFLCTYTKNGVLINREMIAGLSSDSEMVHHSVATIDEDLIIERVSGSQSEKDALYDPVSSKAVSMEILPSGEIIFSLQEG